ncbi:EF-hand domain-containing protein [Vreelandella venusta]
MAIRDYQAAFIITGDASGGILAIQKTDKELSKLDQGFSRSGRQTKRFGNDIQLAGKQLHYIEEGAKKANHGLLRIDAGANIASQGLDVLRSNMVGVAAAMATAFGAGNVIQQARLIADTDSLAKSIGMATSELQAWEYAAHQAGLAQGQMGDILKDVTERIGEFTAEGTGEASALFENLNLKIEDMKRLSPDQQLLRIAEAVSRLETRGEKITYLERLGNDATRLLPLLDNNAALLREYTNEAQALGVAMSEMDNQNAIEANTAISQLSGTVQGLTNQIAADLGPGLAEAVGGLTDFIQEAGGAGAIIDTVTNSATVLAAIMAGRYAAAFAASASKIAANIAATYAQAQADVAATAAAKAKAAETLRIAVSEQAASKRAYENARAIAAATGNTALRTKAIAQMAAANQRAIAAEAAHTAAVNANSAAMGRSTVAAQGLAVASRALNGALALVGGPLGLLVGAGGLLYMFREELGFVQPELTASADRVAELTGRIDDMSRAVVQNRIAELTADLEALKTSFIEVTEVGSATDTQRISGSGVLGVAPGETGRQARAIQSAEDGVVQGIHSPETLVEIKAHEEALEKLESRFESFGSTAITIPPVVRDNEEAAKAAAKAAEEQARALLGIQQEMTPLLKDHADYVERLGVLDKALADGTISEEAYGEAVRWNAEQYRRAATGAEEYEKQTQTLVSTYDRHYQKAQQLQEALEQVNQRWRNDPANAAQYARMIGGIRDEMQQLALDADPAAQEMARAWEEASNRIDETFADAFTGAFDSFDDFTDQLLDGFKRLLGELAYQATLKPIVVQFTQQMGGALGIPGAGGAGAGGGFGGLGSLISGGKSLLGLGSTAAASGTAISGGFMGAAATQSAGSLYGMAATGGVAKAGLASSIASGISTAMPWIAGGLAIDSLLGGGITKAIGGLFGSKSRGPSFDLMTTHQDPNTIFEDVQHGVTASGAFGNVGFHGGNTNRLEETFGSFDNARQFLETIAATDDMLAALAPDDVEHMTYAIQQMRLKSSDAAGITEQLGDRTKAAVSAMSGDFGAFIKTLEGGAEQIVAQAQNARQAHDLLTGASERMGVQFNATGGYSYEVANGMAAMAGGVQSLESMYSSFYQNYYTEAERTAQKTKDVTDAFAALGFAMPENAAQFRELVLAQDTSTEAGRAAQVELLKLEGAFKDVAGSAGDAADASQLAAQRQRLNAQILRLQGDETAALTLERELELQGMDSSLHSLQQRKWALEDEQEANKEAQRAQQERIRTIEQEANAWQRAREQLASFGTGIASYIDGLQSTDKGLASPGDQLAAASAAFDEQYAKAASGDRAAMSSITQYADRFIEAQKGWSASGAQTVGTIDRVTGMLEQLPEMLSPEQFLADEFKGIIGEQTTTLSAIFGNGFNNAVNALSLNFDQIDTNLDGLLTFDEMKAALKGKSTDAELAALIAAVDTNGDGMISKQELANASISDLHSGIAATLSTSFGALDKNVDGLLTFGELKAGLGGIATDETLRAMMQGMDLNSDGVISKLESVVIASMPNDARLTSVLQTQMKDLRTKTLTVAQVRAALSPIATDAEIENLISRVDANGDGVITQQELTAARITGLADSIAASLAPAFGELDKNVDGLLTLDELQTGLKGIATNDAIRGIFAGADLNNDNVINKLESVVITGMPTDARLTTVLRNQMQDLRTKTLTAQQVRAALSPIASNDVIDELIRQVDTNGDGIISAEENTAARVAGLADGIGNALEPMFDAIDIDEDGLIDYDEFGKQFAGMASDESLKRIFNELDRNGDGVISALESMRRSSMDVEGSIKTIEDFFYRAGSPSWGLRVSMSHHQNVDAVRSFGFHAAKEMRREFSPSGTGIGVSLAAPQNGDGARSIARAFKQILGPNVSDGYSVGGYTGAGGVNEPAGIVHKGEVVWSQADIARAGGVSAVESMRKLGAGGLLPVPSRDLPMPDIAAFPLLNRNDQQDVVRDMQRQIAQQNQEITRLLKAIEQHTGASVDVQAAGAKQQISELQKANAALDEMGTAARLQGAR